MSRRPHILVADDQPDVLQALRLLLKSEGFTCRTVSSPAEATEAIGKDAFDAALIDLNYSRDTTSGQEGLDLIEKLRDIEGELPVVVMTAWATIDIAVEAMRRGAGDFIEKPWENRRLISVLRNQVALGQARRREARLSTENALLREEGEGEFIARSAAMRPVLAMIERVAPSDANVLILGENGTGKGVIADLIHRASRRAGQSLIKVNMGGIAESVFESEMFGHVKGAFTDARSDRIGRFELADGGTLFLDEIANIPMSQQPKLLRVLEDGELERVGSSRTLKVDVRLLAATNADLAAEVARGAFRKDLLYRLNTVELRLPPLRERREDIVPMAEAFLRRSGRRYQREDLRFSPSALLLLERYAWPGNVRELSHVIERAVLMTQGSVIEQVDVGAPAVAADSAVEKVALGSMTLEEAEQAMIRNAMDRCEGNIQHAADMLGLSRPALYRRLEKYGIQAA
ncbi:MAG TPA: sigma-54 dependent transcriptional regulator [Xanthomonadaceae bacterium]|nr:sigma-54 dependent transcriptional regulator [Xanthomonadaceae bacterium]